MDIAYTYEKLSDTVNTLSTTSGNSQQKLKEAMIYGFVRIDESDMPLQLTNDYKSIYNRLTQTDPLKDEGRFHASIDAMSEQERLLLIDDIKELEKKMKSIWNKKIRRY